MSLNRDLALGDKPWHPIPSTVQGPALKSRYTQESPYVESCVPYWIEIDGTELHIMSAGPHGIYEIQTETTWYPDPIRDEELRLKQEMFIG